MPKKETKTEQTSPLREAKPKKLGLKVPELRMPHLELVHPQEPRPEEKPKTIPTQTRQTTQTRQSVSPEKDFQKVPNSHTKIAIPEGLFKAGKSKHLYDVLYSLTRGAIEPKRSVRISKTKLMKLAGIGSRITFDSIITYFDSIGLVKVSVFAGEHAGNEFEVFTYEETLPSHTRQPSHTSQTAQTSPAQNLDTVVSLESSQTRQGSIVENKETYASPKTLFKDFKDSDDEKGNVFQDFIAKFEELAQKYTGKNFGISDRESLGRLANVLAEELERAASRTKQISNVAAFLATHLERKFNKPVAPESKPKHIEVGKSMQKFEPEALTGEMRETVLNNLREFVEEGKTDFVLNQKPSYTAADWDWLLKNLKIDI